jgi:hypothetical protein
MDQNSGQSDQLDARLARQIVEVLGQSGTPPPRGVRFYNVGNEKLLHVMEEQYLGSYLADGGAVFKLVVGDYGSGKSHFLYCVRDLAWAHNFAVSKVDLSPRESPYDDQKRVYAAIAANILWHEPGALGDDERGLIRFLDGTLRRMTAPHGLDIDEAGASELPEVRALLQTLSMTPIDSMSYGRAIHAYFTATLEGKTLLRDSLGRWLHGEEVSPDDMRNLRSVSVTEKINKNNAFKMLRSLCQAVRALSYNGLVLLFDEGDRMLSVSGKSEKTSTDNLREVIDRCRDELPGAMFMYAVPPEFLNNVVPKYPALQQRIKSPGSFSRANPFSPQIDLEHLDFPDDELLARIGQKLLPIFELAYNVAMNTELQTANIATFSVAARNSYLATNHRRLFVKALIAEWYRQKENGEQLINADYADAAIRSEHQDLDSQADQSQRPY